MASVAQAPPMDSTKPAQMNGGATKELTPYQRRELEEKKQLASVRDLLAKAEAQLAMALPKGIPASYMIRVVLTVVQRTPKLLQCHPITLLGAVFQAAQLGLVPDGVLGQAYLVPFKNRKKNRDEVQFIPGYRGVVTLARRSGEVSTIGAEAVHKKDKFVYTLGTNPTIEHVPTDDPDPGPITHVYAFARLKDGGYQIVVMNVRQVMAIKARSASVKAGVESPWDTDPEWMFKKTAIKQLCKLLPVSTETQRALALDDKAEAGLPQDLSLLADPENETPTVDDGDVIEGEQLGPAEILARDLDCGPAEAAAVFAGFERLALTAAARLVQVKKYRGKAGELLQLLREMSGEPLPVVAATEQPATPATSTASQAPPGTAASTPPATSAGRFTF